MSVVVDTDVVSYIVKGDTRGALYQSHLANRIASISFMTHAELDCGRFQPVGACVGSKNSRSICAATSSFIHHPLCVADGRK